MTMAVLYIFYGCDFYSSHSQVCTYYIASNLASAYGLIIGLFKSCVHIIFMLLPLLILADIVLSYEVEILPALPGISCAFSDILPTTTPVYLFILLGLVLVSSNLGHSSLILLVTVYYFQIRQLSKLRISPVIRDTNCLLCCYVFFFE